MGKGAHGKCWCGLLKGHVVTVPDSAHLASMGESIVKHVIAVTPHLRKRPALKEDLLQEGMAAVVEVYNSYSPRDESPNFPHAVYYRVYRALVDYAWRESSLLTLPRRLPSPGRVRKGYYDEAVYRDTAALTWWDGEERFPSSAAGDPTNYEDLLSKAGDDMAYVRLHSQGLTTAEVGEALGVSKARAAARITRGLERIRGSL